MMKKKVISAMLCLACVASMTACGKGNNSGTEGTNTSDTEAAQATNYSGKRSGEFDLNPSELVTNLCDYNKIPVTVDSSYEITEKAENDYLTQLLQGYGGIAYLENKDKDKVEDGDYVLVNYTGYLDGEAFENGSAENALIDIDNNMQVGATTGFITGFSDGIKGAKVGETVSSDVTFPEDYNVDTLAGKKTTFEFEILGIYTHDPVTFDTLTDEMVEKTFGEYTSIVTVKDFKEAVDSDLKNNIYSATVEKVKAYMLENCEVTVPEDYLAARLYEYEESLKKDYCTDTESLEDYISANGNKSFAEYEDTWRDSITDQIKTELIFSVVADKEGIEFDEEGFSTYIEYIKSNSNGTFADDDAVYDYFGSGHADEGKKYLHQQYVINLAVDKVSEDAVVSYEDSTEDSTEEATESPE